MELHILVIPVKLKLPEKQNPARRVKRALKGCEFNCWMTKSYIPVGSFLKVLKSFEPAYYSRNEV